MKLAVAVTFILTLSAGVPAQKHAGTLDENAVELLRQHHAAGGVEVLHELEN